MRHFKQFDISCGLPKSRYELFWGSFSTRFESFILPNFITALFYIPLFIWLFCCISTILFASDELSIPIKELLWLSCIGICICFAVVGPVQCGMTKLMQIWSRNGFCSKMDTFFSGMKDNWKKGILFSALSALILFISMGAGYLYLTGDFNIPGLRLLGSIFSSMLLCFVLLLRQVMYSLIVTYEISLCGLLKNAFILSVADFFRCFGICILRILPSLTLVLSIIFFPDALSIVFLTFVIYYLLIGFSVDGFLRASFCNYLMEKYININIPDARVDIGLASETVINKKE